MSILLDNVSKYFGRVAAVQDLSLEIEDGSFVALLGPSGCGKTTTLLMIAGIYRPSRGRILFGGRDVTSLDPKDRNVGMVFQSYALYPHMTVYDNIAFPLKLKKKPKPEIDRKVREVAELLRIQHLLDRKPAQLSGGQQQRVALGRALAKEPDILLLDEPLSNLDAKLRVAMRAELKRLQRDLGITTVYVTHDQTEAMSMADKIAVMNNGRLQQYAEPQSLYEKPANTFVAEFVGSPPMNIVEGVVVRDENGFYAEIPGTGFRQRLSGRVAEEALRRGGKLLIGFRPEYTDVLLDGEGAEGTVYVVENLGRDLIVHVELGSVVVKALASPNQKLEVGQRVVVAPRPDKIVFFDAENGRLLG